MKRISTIGRGAVALLCIALAGAAHTKQGRQAATLPDSPEAWLAAANAPPAEATLKRGAQGPAALRVQVLLDRAGFSPGEIDGRYGEATEKALAAWWTARGQTSPGDDALRALLQDATPVLEHYTVKAEDVAGPFQPVPDDIMEKAKLPALGYSSAVEGLAEKFHISPKLLRALNRRAKFVEGETIVVPSVLASAPAPKGAKVVVSKSGRSVKVLGQDEKVLAYFPASVGSRYDPLPIGTWKIQGKAKDPVFHYDPKLFWNAEPSDTKAKIAPGPNNPVGRVWIDLSKPHYGIHGTPEPSQVGRAQSHGCIRLTNWDALKLAEMVAPGMPAVFEE